MSFTAWYKTRNRRKQEGSGYTLVIVVLSIILSMSVSVLYVVLYERKTEDMHTQYLNGYEMALSGVEIMQSEIQAVIDQNRHELEKEILLTITGYPGPLNEIVYYEAGTDDYNGNYHLKQPDTSMAGEKNRLYYSLYCRAVAKLIADNFSAPLKTSIGEYNITVNITENYSDTYTIVSEAEKNGVKEKVSACIEISSGEEIIEEGYLFDDEYTLAPDWDRLSEVSEGIIICQSINLAELDNNLPVIIVNPEETELLISASGESLLYAMVLSKGSIESDAPVTIKGKVFTKADIGENIFIENDDVLNNLAFDEIAQKREILHGLGLIDFPGEHFYISKIFIDSMDLKLISVKKIR